MNNHLVRASFAAVGSGHLPGVELPGDSIGLDGRTQVLN
jgi:hypothetical protein